MTLTSTIKRGLSFALALTLSASALLGQDALATGTNGGTMAQALAEQVASAAQTVTDRIEVPQDLYHVRVDGVPLTQDPKFTNLNGYYSASVRVLAEAICPGVTVAWNGTSAIVWKEGVISMSITPGMSYVTANERYLYVPGGVQTKDSTVMLPLEVILKALDATFVWNADGSLDITTGNGGILNGSRFYKDEDIYWLSRIIYAESGNQPLKGKLAVGNVVLNRVNSSRFPNTIKGVIFQKNQFSPVSNGTIYRSPSTESVIAAKLCLDGAVALNNVLYFNVNGLRSWASRNRTYVATIASHTFYA